MHQTDPELIRRFHAGQCNAEEIEFLKQWLEQDINFFAEEGITAISDNVLEEEIWQNIQQQLLLKRRSRSAHVRKIWLSAAAACLLGIVVSSLFLYVSRPGHQHEHKGLTSLRTYTASKGTRSRLVLEDSTVVHLMGGSSIQYPEHFAGKTRSIALLQGEVFLEVAHRPQQPFVVNSSGAQVKVLGTKFNIQNIADDSCLSVMLTEGSVQFSTAGNINTLLKPGQQLRYNKSIGLVTALSRFSQTETAMGWTKGILIFNEEPLYEVFKKLERYYGVRFELKQKINLNIPLTATVTDLPLQRVLLMMEYSTAMKFKLMGQTVEVRKSEK